MAERRRLHIGLDYGTSTSKIVVRDYGHRGGERAYVLEFNHRFRFDSSVGLAQGNLLFGRSAGTFQSGGEIPLWYESLKIRVAMENESIQGPAFSLSGPPYPQGLNGEGLITLTLWYLLSVVGRAIERKYGRPLDHFGLGVTVGIPMRFFDRLESRNAYLDIARKAWWLFRRKGAVQGSILTVDRARDALADAEKNVPPPDVVPQDQVRDWIRSEAEAAMWWAFRSPGTPDGLYAKIDVGAGTAHSSIFRIVASPSRGKWVKDRMAFFGAHAVPVGMDAVDAALAEVCGVPSERCLSLRGKENQILRSFAPARSAIKPPLDVIFHGYRLAWQQAYGKDKRTEAWRDYDLFLIGGGSLVNEIRAVCVVHPYSNERYIRHRIRFTEKPRDLMTWNNRSLPERYLPFVQVAYGLSSLSLDVPEVDTPSEIPPIELKPSIRPLKIWEDIFAK